MRRSSALEYFRGMIGLMDLEASLRAVAYAQLWRKSAWGQVPTPNGRSTVGFPMGLAEGIGFGLHRRDYV
jgi:hypothetical protein